MKRLSIICNTDEYGFPWAEITDFLKEIPEDLFDIRTEMSITHTVTDCNGGDFCKVTLEWATQEVKE